MSKYPKDTDKLGDVEDHPPNSRFNQLLRRRMPGWHADTQNLGLTPLFPEEVLRFVTNAAGTTFHEAFEAFFDEPASGEPNPRWLGVHVPPPTDDFTRYLHEIAIRVRRYNAALYWMRRLHFAENARPMGNPPAPNPHGDPDQSPTPIPDQRKITLACREWDECVKELNSLLDCERGDQRFGFDTKADMLEVNGYIISMRIVSTARSAASSDDSKPRFTQLGGSSSSYVYISSPFYSSARSGLQVEPKEPAQTKQKEKS